ADLSAVAAVIAEPARARILLALADGRALPASMLSAEAGLSAPATTHHLKRLLEAGLVTVEASGRHRYYRLAGPHVAIVLEALASLAPTHPVRSLRQDTHAAHLRNARSCYDHLAGRLGVAVTAGLLDRKVLVATDGVGDTSRRDADRYSAPVPHHPYDLGPRARPVLADLGVNLDALLDAPRASRPVLRFCVDWTEQRHHLAGALGAALLTAFTDQEWVVRHPHRRTITLTKSGSTALDRHLGVNLDLLAA
ncbi:MAG: helix-turn-helix transcriptional regulator, partial [Acidimicrobiaceae bacterium]|nr:helix-turn-helix transcriptional regulator [Acidimicrobiaceae bacterium]